MSNSKKTTEVTLISNEELIKLKYDKYKGMSSDARLEYSISQLQLKIDTLVRKVTNLGLLGGRELEPVNWLKSWSGYTFSSTSTSAEIDAFKDRLIAFVTKELMKLNLTTNSMYTIVFNWVEDAPFIFRLEAYINPPPILAAAGPGGGGSAVVSPVPPPQPQP
jgi:hypothetical protein